MASQPADGFYSIVQKGGETDLSIRARARAVATSTGYASRTCRRFTETVETRGGDYPLPSLGTARRESWTASARSCGICITTTSKSEVAAKMTGSQRMFMAAFGVSSASSSLVGRMARRKRSVAQG